MNVLCVDPQKPLYTLGTALIPANLGRMARSVGRAPSASLLHGQDQLSQFQDFDVTVRRWEVRGGKKGVLPTLRHCLSDVTDVTVGWEAEKRCLADFHATVRRM